MSLRLVRVLASFVVLAAAGRAGAQTIDLTPPSGTLQDPGNAIVWVSRGMTVSFSQAVTITAVEWKASLAVNATFAARIYDESNMQLVASGTATNGTGVQAWNNSKVNYTFQAGKAYRVGFYVSDVNTVFPRKDTPTVPYTINNVNPAVNATVTQHWSNGSDAYPTGGPNVWAPFFRLVTTPPMAPVISVLPLTINFGNQQVGLSSAPQNITISNTGNAVLTINSIGTAAPFSVQAPALPTTVQPGTSLVVTAQFTPQAAGAASGTITIGSNDANNPSVKVTVSGTGTAGPSVSVAPSPLNLGTVALGGNAQATVTITNSGNAALTLWALQIGGANPADFRVVNPPAMPVAIAAMGTQKVTVLFAPTARGLRSAGLLITTDAPMMNQVNVPLSGTASGGPLIGASPNPLGFGTTNIGVVSNGMLTITNSGDAPLLINSFLVAGPDAASFTVTTPAPLTIQPAMTAPVAVQFKPAAVGSRYAQLVINSNDAVTPAFTVPMTGAGISGSVSIDPGAVDFGAIAVGATSQAQAITVINTGAGTLTIGSASIGGPDAAAFTLAPVNLPATIPPNGTQSFSVTFAPKMVSSAGAKLTIASDDPGRMTADVALLGRGVSGTVAVSPSTIDFGPVLVGRTSAPRSVEIRNVGSAPLSVASLTLSGPQAAAYAMNGAPMLPSVVAPGQGITLTLALTPAMAGAAPASLQIASDDPMTPQAKVDLTGTGVSTQLSVSPTAIDFGYGKVGVASAPATITITNTTNDTLTLLDATMAGANAADFTVTSAAGALAAGKSKTVTVTWKPAAAGDGMGTATFAVMEKGVTQSMVMLSGKASSMRIGASPGTLAFGNVTVGTVSARQAVTITNQTGAPLYLSGANPDDPDFVVAGLDPKTAIPAGATATFTVGFAPSLAGDKSATIAVSVLGVKDPELVIKATGTGVQPVITQPSKGCAVGGGRRSESGPVALLLVGIALLRRRRRA